MFVVPAVWLSRHALSKPSMVLAISGLATFHRSRALGFCVKPIALPSALTTALFCSCAWSTAMAEKGRVDLCTTKLPRSNYFATSGSRSCSVVISRICTGTQREQCVWSRAKNHGASALNAVM